jgi:flagellin
MPTVLNTNVASLRAADNLLGAQEKLANSVERLSSGLRINRAKDDAAGLGVSNSLTRQINGTNQGIRNLNDGISMVQTAEAAISAAMEMGQRILMLATQGANGTLGVTERTAIRDEMRQLAIAINGIGGRTAYSGNSLLNVATTAAAATQFSLQTTDVTSDVINLANTAFFNIGAGASAAGSAVVATAILAGAFDFANGQATGMTNAINATNLVSATASTATTAFQSLITAATSYVTALGTQRGLLGAYQNQIEYTVSNVTELSSNLTAARSRVTDTDYAAETAALTKGQILQQAATAMLAQANQMPNVILTLLK